MDKQKMQKYVDAADLICEECLVVSESGAECDNCPVKMTFDTKRKHISSVSICGYQSFKRELDKAIKDFAVEELCTDQMNEVFSCMCVLQEAMEKWGVEV